MGEKYMIFSIQMTKCDSFTFHRLCLIGDTQGMYDTEALREDEGPSRN